MNLALDTNVLVRLLTGDDEEQCLRAVHLIEAEANQGRKVFVSFAVILETEWVLRSRYRIERDLVRSAFAALLEAQDLVVEHAGSLEEALRLFRQWPSADFADCMQVAHARMYGTVLATFDKSAAELPGAVLVP